MNPTLESARKEILRLSHAYEELSREVFVTKKGHETLVDNAARLRCVHISEGLELAVKIIDAFVK